MYQVRIKIKTKAQWDEFKIQYRYVDAWWWWTERTCYNRGVALDKAKELLERLNRKRTEEIILVL